MTVAVCSGEAVVSAARLWLGTPYRHQASARGRGCDCLGLVRGVWRDLGGEEPASIPPYTPDWSEAGGEERLYAAAMRHLVPCGPPDMPEAGDILLFRMKRGAVAKHLAICTSNRMPAMLHAYSGHGVVEVPLGAHWMRRLVARFRFPEV